VDMDMYLSPPTADINAELKTNVWTPNQDTQILATLSC
jgi:hypothetical protein